MNVFGQLPLLLMALVSPARPEPADDAALRHFGDLVETPNHSLGRPKSAQFIPDDAQARRERTSP
jgi:hypothetical protein